MDGLAAADDVAGSFLDQDFMLVGLGIITNHGRAVRREGSRGPGNVYLGTGPLDISSSGQIHRTGANRDRHAGLLLVIGRILFNHDQRVLLDGVIGTVVEHHFRHAFRRGLNDITLFQGQTVIGRPPTVAVGFLNLHYTFQVGEMSLAAAGSAYFVGS